MTTSKHATKPGVNTPTKHREAPNRILGPVPKASLPTANTVEKQWAVAARAASVPTATTVKEQSAITVATPLLPPPANPHHVELVNDGRPVAEQKADSILSPITTNALISMNALRQSIPKEDQEAIGIGAFDRALRSKVAAVVGGDMKEIEAVLASNVFSLNALFAQLTTRAQLNMGEHYQAAEAYLRMAFRAQSQCRSSAEALGEMKNPRPVYINPKQVNVAAGPQQVNNGPPPQQPHLTSQSQPASLPNPVAREEITFPANKLLETK